MRVRQTPMMRPVAPIHPKNHIRMVVFQLILNQMCEAIEISVNPVDLQNLSPSTMGHEESPLLPPPGRVPIIAWVDTPTTPPVTAVTAQLGFLSPKPVSNERDPELTKAKTELENTINELKDVLTKLKPENANFVISFLTPPKKNENQSSQRSAWAEESSPEPPILTTIYNFLTSDQPVSFPLMMINLIQIL